MAQNPLEHLGLVPFEESDEPPHLEPALGTAERIRAWAAEVVGPSGSTVRLSTQAPCALVTQLIALAAQA